VGLVDEALRECSASVVEPELDDISDIHSVDEVQRVRCDDHPHAWGLTLSVDKIDQFPLLGVVKMGVGLVVRDHKV